MLVLSLDRHNKFGKGNSLLLFFLNNIAPDSDYIVLVFSNVPMPKKTKTCELIHADVIPCL